MKKKLCILFGGRSSEYEVSLVSSYGVLTNVDRSAYDVIPVGITKAGKWFLYRGELEKIKSGEWVSDENNLYDVAIDPTPGAANIIVFGNDGEVSERIKPDVVFPVLHGANGEDGTVQGLFEVAGIPFVGPDHTSGGVCMDKAFTKCIVGARTKVRQAKAVILEKCGDRIPDDAAQQVAKLGYPVFVKPARAGSSVGVTKVKDEKGLGAALEVAFREDSKILVEEAIAGREIEVAVMETEGKCVASVPGEIDPGFEFYDYDTKYQNDTASYYIPARLDDAAAKAIRDAAVEIFECLGCRTLSRVDFFVKDNGDMIFNEINTIPGFTPISMYPKLFMHSGMTYTEVISALVESALKK
ncbi:MAG: D-alanine--D-alanine ligase [Clostridia bacterium]|nr:D-alanine--D-alanine ligase [Clostridia bacterium]